MNANGLNRLINQDAHLSDEHMPWKKKGVRKFCFQKKQLSLLILTLGIRPNGMQLPEHCFWMAICFFAMAFITAAFFPH